MRKAQLDSSYDILSHGDQQWSSIPSTTASNLLTLPKPTLSFLIVIAIYSWNYINIHYMVVPFVHLITPLLHIHRNIHVQLKWILPVCPSHHISPSNSTQIIRQLYRYSLNTFYFRITFVTAVTHLFPLHRVTICYIISKSIMLL
jgi:hypothetical protein